MSLGGPGPRAGTIDLSAAGSACLRPNPGQVRQAWTVDNGKENGNDLTRAKQRDVPSGEEAQRSWVTVAGAAVAGALATDVYNDVKAAGKAVVDKIRKPEPSRPGGSPPAPCDEIRDQEMS